MTLPSAHQRNRIEPLSTEPQAHQTRFVPQRGCGARACIARQYDGRGGPVWYHCGITGGAIGPLAYLRALTLTCRTPAARTRSLDPQACPLAAAPHCPICTDCALGSPSPPLGARGPPGSSPILTCWPPLIAQLPMLRACRTWRAAAASRAPCHAACCPLHAVTAPPGWAVPGFQIRCATAGWCRPQAKV